MAEMNEILAKQQLADINRALAAVNKAVQVCEIVEQCGIDCADRRAILADMRQQAEQFKTAFFPTAK